MYFQAEGNSYIMYIYFRKKWNCFFLHGSHFNEQYYIIIIINIKSLASF